ncbi:endonuclease III domain-containing protein [Patescibacteria group bacterium]
MNYILTNNKKIINHYKLLRKKYKKPQEQWFLWSKNSKTLKEKEEIIIGSILTQQTSWKNVEIAISQLKNAGINSIASIYDLSKKDKAKLSKLIKPSGFYNQKTEYLINICSFIIKKYKTLKKMSDIPFLQLREELLNIKGIGKETADSILLYAIEKPIFVIDEYTKRFVKKHKIADEYSYEYLRKLFETNLPKNHKLYQDFHALIVIDGKKS